MKLRILFILFILPCCLYAQTQQKIQGKVVDAERQPIIYATIQVLNGDKTLVAGAISDADGRFTATIPDGCRLEKLLVRISYIGYQTCEIVPEAYDMGQIILQQETQMLGEVNIVGRKPVYKLENGNIRTTIKNTLLSDVGKAIDVIGYLPGVWSDGRSITVLGKGAPVYYINNRRVRNMAEVDMLSSKQIESVEVIYNPGAEYDSSVQAVIKIKTIQRIEDYFGGEVEAGLMYAADWKYGGAANLNFRKKKTELFGSVEYEDGTQAEATLDTRTEAFTQKPWLTTSHYKSVQKGDKLSGKIGITQVIGNKHQVGAQYSYSNTGGSNRLQGNSLNWVAEEQAEHSVADNYRDRENRSHYFNAFYAGKPSRQLSLDATVDVVANTIDTKLHNVEQIGEATPQDVRSLSSSDNLMYSGRVAATYEKGGHKAVLGSEVTHILSQSVYSEASNILPQTDTETEENSCAFFLSYRLKSKVFSFLAGLRYEYTAKEYRDFLQPEKDNRNHYGSLLPNVAFSVPMGKADMSLAYSQTLHRPSFHQLDGGMWYIDRFFVGQGNPQLKTATKHDLTWQLLYKTFRVAATYIHQENPILQTMTVYDDAHSTILQSYQNIKRFQSLTLAASWSANLERWRPMLNVTLSQPFFKFQTSEGYSSFNNPRLFASWNNQIRCSKSCILGVNMSYMTAGDNYNCINRNGQWGMNVNLRYSFLKDRLSLRAGVQDLFQTRNQFKSYTMNAAVTQQEEQCDKTRTFMLVLSYRFYKQANKYRLQENVNLRRLNE